MSLRLTDLSDQSIRLGAEMQRGDIESAPQIVRHLYIRTVKEQTPVTHQYL